MHLAIMASGEGATQHALIESQGSSSFLRVVALINIQQPRIWRTAFRRLMPEASKRT